LVSAAHGDATAVVAAAKHTGTARSFHAGTPLGWCDPGVSALSGIVSYDDRSEGPIASVPDVPSLSRWIA